MLKQHCELTYVEQGVSPTSCRSQSALIAGNEPNLRQATILDTKRSSGRFEADQRV